MATLLLIIIYLAFISLGLPDAVLGAAWPQARLDLGVPLDSLGFTFIATTGATIISSLMSGYLIKKLGTYKVTVLSILLTSISLIGITYIPSFYFLVLLSFPLGFGAGSIDTALNNYVANHYKSHHMNFLHAFWGIGATLGPIVISSFFLLGYTWRNGYFALGIIQLVIFLIVLGSFKLWKRNGVSVDTEQHYDVTYKEVLNTRGVLLAMSLFLIYCAIEFAIGNWGASYLVSERTLLKETAGSMIGVYYAGITIGRILSGFVSFKISNNQLIMIGIVLLIITSTINMFMIPVGLLYVTFFLQGIGLAPIFPALIHETPTRYGKNKSQHVIGLQMASAYTGASLIPALFGILARNTSLGIYTWFILGLGVLLFILNLITNKLTKA